MTEPYRAERPDKLEDRCQGTFDEEPFELVDPTGWAERGYVPASFGGMPVLLTPDLAAQISTCRETLP